MGRNVLYGIVAAAVLCFIVCSGYIMFVAWTLHQHFSPRRPVVGTAANEKQAGRAGIPCYEEDIQFTPTYASHYTSRSNKGPARPYTTVKWLAQDRQNPGPCPLTITIDGRVWTGDDLEWERFIGNGGIDVSYHYDGIGPKPDPEKNGFGAIFYSEKSVVSILALYSPQKQLVRIFVTPGSEYYERLTNSARYRRGSPPLSGPLKDYGISFYGRSITLPTDYDTMIKSLGEPLRLAPYSEVYGSGKKPE